MNSPHVIQLHAADTHKLDAFSAAPDDESKGGVVIVQEIFGLTGHICELVMDYASQGYHCIAPALFDRVEPGIVLPYDQVEKGRAIIARCQEETLLTDLAAAVEHLNNPKGVAIVGYCWGGSLAYLASCRIPGLRCAISYYGTRVLDMLDRQPLCPLMFHFGEADKSLPAEAIERIRQANPASRIYTYPGAGHGFNCTDRAAYHAASANLARQRSLAFINEHFTQ